MNNVKILVVGGGFAGARTAQELSKKGYSDVTLVDRKNYFEVTYATLRGVTEPDNWGRRSRVQYEDFILGNFVKAGVVELREDCAILDSGDSLYFDYAVVATGSSYASFEIAKSDSAVDISDREAEFSREYDRLSTASSVLIVGGGPVGVEFAGEVADYFPGIDVTLVHGGSALLDSFSARAGEIAEQKLKQLNVEVVLDTLLIDQDDGGYTSQDGKRKFSADCVYLCRGAKPNSSMLKQNFSSRLNKDGRLMVDEFLRVQGCEKIFAIGDVADVDELKLGYLADIQGAKASKNIDLLIRGKKLKRYKTNPKMGLVPVGRSTGLVQLPFAVTTLKMLVNTKQKDLFISKNFKTLGVAKKLWPSASSKETA